MLLVRPPTPKVTWSPEKLKVIVPLSVSVTFDWIRTLTPAPKVRVAPCATVTFWPKVVVGVPATERLPPDAIDRTAVVSFSESTA